MLAHKWFGVLSLIALVKVFAYASWTLQSELLVVSAPISPKWYQQHHIITLSHPSNTTATLPISIRFLLSRQLGRRMRFVFDLKRKRSFVFVCLSSVFSLLRSRKGGWGPTLSGGDRYGERYLQIQTYWEMPFGGVIRDLLAQPLLLACCVFGTRQRAMM